MLNRVYAHQCLYCNYELGLTFIELLIGIAIMAIILAVATPAFNNFIMNNRMTASTDAFANALKYARGSALNQNISMRVCPVGASGSTTCGTNWNSGWMVVSIPTTGAPTLLLAYNTSSTEPTISSVATSGGAAVSEVIFDSRGLSTTQANFILCDARGGAYARSVAVLPTGSVQASNKTGTAVWDGSALTCS